MYHNPKLPERRRQTGDLMRRTETAMAALHSIQLEAPSDHWYQRGVQHKTSREWLGAKYCFDRVLLIDSRHWKAWLMLALVYSRLGDIDNSRKCIISFVNSKYLAGINEIKEVLEEDDFLFIQKFYVEKFNEVFTEQVWELLDEKHKRDRSMDFWREPDYLDFLKTASFAQISKCLQIEKEEIVVLATSYLVIDNIIGVLLQGQEYEENRVRAYHTCNTLCEKMLDIFNVFILRKSQQNNAIESGRLYIKYLYCFGFFNRFNEFIKTWNAVLILDKMNPLAHYEMGSIHATWYFAGDSNSAFNWLQAAQSLEPGFTEKSYFLEMRGDAVYSTVNKDWNVVNIMQEQVGEHYYTRRIINDDYSFCMQPYYFDNSRPLMIRNYQHALDDYHKVLEKESDNLKVKADVAKIEAWFKKDFVKGVNLLTEVIDAYCDFYYYTLSHETVNYPLNFYQDDQRSRNIAPVCNALLYRGLIKMNQKDYQGAIYDFNRNINLRSGHFPSGHATELFFHRAEAYLIMGDITASLLDLDRLIEKCRWHNDDRVYYRRSQVRERLGDVDGAAEDMQQVKLACENDTRQKQLTGLKSIDKNYLYRLN